MDSGVYLEDEALVRETPRRTPSRRLGRSVPEVLAEMSQPVGCGQALRVYLGTRGSSEGVATNGQSPVGRTKDYWRQLPQGL